MRHIILISGKDSLTTAIVQQMAQPDLDYELIFNDTGAELPEVYEWLNKVGDYLGQEIKRVGSDLRSWIDEFQILPSHQKRYCTKYSKIFPLVDYLNGEPANVYYGLRYDEPHREGYSNTSSKGKGAAINAVYPLRQMHIGLPGVWRILKDRNLLPPQFFWKSMYDMVGDMMGDDFAIVDRLYEWDKNALFAWRSRPNCYFCFYQRLYEFVGLLEYHPEYFHNAAFMEMLIGGNGFWLKKDNPLHKIEQRAEEIKHKRAKAICRILYSFSQSSILESSATGLQLTSCGLMCGK